MVNFPFTSIWRSGASTNSQGGWKNSCFLTPPHKSLQSINNFRRKKRVFSRFFVFFMKNESIFRSWKYFFHKNEEKTYFFISIWRSGASTISWMGKENGCFFRHPHKSLRSINKKWTKKRVFSRFLWKLGPYFAPENIFHKNKKKKTFFFTWILWKQKRRYRLWKWIFYVFLIFHLLILCS